MAVTSCSHLSSIGSSQRKYGIKPHLTVVIDSPRCLQIQGVVARSYSNLGSSYAGLRNSIILQQTFETFVEGMYLHIRGMCIPGKTWIACELELQNVVPLQNLGLIGIYLCPIWFHVSMTFRRNCLLIKVCSY